MQDRYPAYEGQKGAGIDRLAASMRKAIDLYFERETVPANSARADADLHQLEKSLIAEFAHMQLPKEHVEPFLKQAETIAKGRRMGTAWIDIARELGRDIPEGAIIDEEAFYPLLREDISERVDKVVDTFFKQPEEGHVLSTMHVGEDKPTTARIKMLQGRSQIGRVLATAALPASHLFAFPEKSHHHAGEHDPHAKNGDKHPSEGSHDGEHDEHKKTDPHEEHGDKHQKKDSHDDKHGTHDTETEKRNAARELDFLKTRATKTVLDYYGRHEKVIGEDYPIELLTIEFESLSREEKYRNDPLAAAAAMINTMKKRVDHHKHSDKDVDKKDKDDKKHDPHH